VNFGWGLCELICFLSLLSFCFFRRGNIKSMSRNSSKTSIKLILAFYNLQLVEQRSQRVNPTPHRGWLCIWCCCFCFFIVLLYHSVVVDLFFLSVVLILFLLTYLRTSNSNGKDGWPTLSGHSKLPNGLSEDRKSPPLLDYLDQEAINSDGLESELGPGQRTALSPFSSNCDSNR